MLSRTYSLSPSLRSILWVASVLLCFCGSCARAQSDPLPPSPSQQALLADARHPALPHVPPEIATDRDPVSSPDSIVPAPASAVLSPDVGRTGELHKLKDGIYTMHQDVDEVLLTCSVTDEKGRPVTDLKRSDFRVWEDGVPQVTGSFQHQDLPVSIGILVDSSGSMRDKRAVAKAAALDLVRASNPQDAEFIVNFSERAFLDQNFTSDIASLSRALARSNTHGTTALYDAVVASADELARHGQQRKQVLLIITDGADNASRLTLEQAIHRVQMLGGPVVYAIGMLFDTSKAEARQTRSVLDMLSQETGGVAYFPQSMQDVGTIALEVARDIRNQYTIGYHSTNPAIAGDYHGVHVEAAARKHGRLIVRTRKGYLTQRPVHQQPQALQAARQ